MPSQPHDFTALEKKIEAIHDLLQRFSTGNQETRLLGALYRPCTPSSAEYAFIANALDSLLEQARAVSKSYAALTDAVERVGPKSDVIQPPVRNPRAMATPVMYSIRSMRVKLSVSRSRYRKTPLLTQRNGYRSRTRAMRPANLIARS